MILDRESPNIGYWRFMCASCGIAQGNRWVVRDRDTLTVLRGRIQSECPDGVRRRRRDERLHQGSRHQRQPGRQSGALRRQNGGDRQHGC